jgi:lysyl-tRNA synthetase, class I
MSQKQQKPAINEEIPSIHWADRVAEELIEKHPNAEKFVCASGISPSGMVHIGNFREVITVEFVVRALLDRGKKVRFIYSWDDYDAFRKVPANLPNQEMLTKELRKPLSRVPDPYGELPSYAARFEKAFESEITQLGVTPEFIYQNIPYQRGDYVEGVRHAIANQKTIVKILNASRTEPLPDNWTCVSIFCKKCHRDTTELLSYTPPNEFKYRCKVCKEELTTDMSKEGGVKLLWRVDWPMRWAKEGVDFEPGGKDHSSQGGSYDTGVGIVREVWKREPPHYVQYDFVLAKGIGSKLSSSSGNLITLGEALEIYEPAVIRWIFASRKPNLDFSIAFDLDVMKAYDDFDRTERFAYGAEEGEEKKANYEKRIYEFCVVERRGNAAYTALPTQFSFRHLCNILQIHQGNLEKAKTYYAKVIHNEADHARFQSRATRAWNWITRYAPPDFRFQLRTGSDIPKTKYPAPVTDLVTALKSGLVEKHTEEEIAGKLFELMKKHQVEPKAFFQDAYNVLIGKPQGPKLASFLGAMGSKTAIDIFEKSL